METGLYVGIDPGEFGAIAAVRDDVCHCWDLPRGGPPAENHQRLHELLREVSSPGLLRLVVEVSDTIPPNWAPNRASSFGQSVGVIEGLLRGMCIPYVRVFPHYWVPRMNAPREKEARIEAMERTYKAGTFRGPRGGANGGGRADAAYLARLAEEMGPWPQGPSYPYCGAMILPNSVTAAQLKRAGCKISSAVQPREDAPKGPIQ